MRLMRVDDVGFEFAYPRNWELQIEAVEVPSFQGSILVKLSPPDRQPEDELERYGEYLHGLREVEILAFKSEENWRPEACQGGIYSSPVTLLTEGRSQGVLVGNTGERVEAEKGYVGWGDGAFACLSDGKGRGVQIHMFPGSSKEDPDFLHIVRSFEFTSGSLK